MRRADKKDDPRISSLPRSPEADVTFYMLKGKERVLRMHRLLAELSARCDQIGAMDHISLFLNSTMNKKNIPFLILASTQAEMDPFSLHVEGLVGAAVVYEYEVFGWPTKVFVTDDGSGSRTVIAAPPLRSALTIKVCEHLIQRGARAALLSYKEEVNPQPQDIEIARIVVPSGTVWGSQVRTMSTYLIIQSTLDATLAQLGRHTRRNLRYYRRRAELELGCQFFPEARSAISKTDFCKLIAFRLTPSKNEQWNSATRHLPISRTASAWESGRRMAGG